MLQELIDTADKLCTNLDMAAQNERIYTTNICIEFEKYSWQILRMMDELKQIKEYCGV